MQELLMPTRLKLTECFLCGTATSASSLSSAQALPGWVMDAKDIEILQLQSGKPYLLGVGSFGSVCCQSVVADHQSHNMDAGGCFNI